MSTCIHCRLPLEEHDERTNDRGQTVRVCPRTEPPTSRESALRHIERLREQLKEGQ